MTKISNLELNTIIYFLIRSTCAGLLVSSTLSLAHNNAYLSILIGALIGLLVFFLYFLILKKNIVLPKIGRIIISIAVFLLTCLLFTDLVNFVSSQYLYETPKWIVSIAFTIPLIYIGFHEKNVIARTGLVLFYISIFLFIIALSFLIFQIDYSEIFPFMKVDFKDFSLSIFNVLLYIITPLILIIDLPVYNREKLKFKNILPGYILGTLSLFVIIFLVIGIYGYKFDLLIDYPAFQVLKRISSISFLERAEHFIFMQWIFDIFIYLALSINFIKDNFKKKSFVNIIICILIYLCPLYVFSNNDEFLNVATYVMPSVFFISIILFFTVLLIKKRS